MSVTRLNWVFTLLILSIGSASFGQGSFSQEQAKKLAQDKNWNSLIEYGTKWSKAQPNEGMAWYCIGEGAYQKKEYGIATDALQRATQLSPKQTYFWTELGFAAMGAGKKEVASRAIADGERACVGNITADGWYKFGNVAGQLHDYDHAAQDYNAAIKLDPNYAVAWANLGLTKELQGNTKEALRNYDKAAELGNALGRNSAHRIRYQMTPHGAASNNQNHYSANNSRPAPRYNNVSKITNSAYIQQHPNADRTNLPAGGH